MNRFILFAAVFASLITGCDKNTVYKEFQEPRSRRWFKEQSFVFSPVIDDIGSPLDISVALRHVYGFQLQEVPVKLKITSPAGAVTSGSYVLRISASDGTHFGDCSGDLCDLVTKVEDNYQFAEPGKYTMEIWHQVPTEYLPNVMDVGLVISK